MEDRWEKVRQIVREECERIELRILEALKTNGKAKIKLVNGRWEGITGDVLQNLKEVYGALDVERQLKEMAMWIVMNPSDAPKSNYSAFINRWLTRQQNQASLRSIPTAPRATATPPSLCEYCTAPSIGAVNGRRHCREHSRDAMDGIHPPKFMPGVVAKSVAGRD